MLRLALALLLAAPVAHAGTVIDSAGRTVEVPDEIRTVFAAGPPAAILLYVLAPDRMVGWPRANRADELPFIAEPYRDLPEVGTLTGQGGEANVERVLALAPDLILDFGSIRDTYAELADRVQERTGIPYLLIDGRFENTPEALRLLGDVLGVPERAEMLAAETEALFARLDAVIAATPEEARPRTYLARGPNGLETGVIGSINTEIIERAGGINVVGGSDTQRARTDVYEIMAKPAPAVDADMDIRYAIRHLARFDLSHAIVLHQRELVGLVTLREMTIRFIELGAGESATP
jgi:iron complex transport system substrate-binding protein